MSLALLSLAVGLLFGWWAAAAQFLSASPPPVRPSGCLSARIPIRLADQTSLVATAHIDAPRCTAPPRLPLFLPPSMSDAMSLSGFVNVAKLEEVIHTLMQRMVTRHINTAHKHTQTQIDKGMRNEAWVTWPGLC